jgi:lycopene cyclase domain-containing protein
MNEYTIISFLGFFISIAIDLILKTKLILTKKFWIFWMVMAMLILIVNGYLTWRPIVTYGEEFYSGFRLFTIPLEDFLFGFSLITLNIVIWEYYNKKCVKK